MLPVEDGCYFLPFKLNNLSLPKDPMCCNIIWIESIFLTSDTLIGGEETNVNNEYI